jgi:DNA-directed RNA polymerase specialized sigma24 family protein
VSGPDDLDVEELAAGHQELGAIREAVDRLSPKLREAFVLHQGGLSRRRIALVLHINENAVSKRLHDARARLRVLVGSRAPHRGAHFAVRGSRRDGPGPAAAQR